MIGHTIRTTRTTPPPIPLSNARTNPKSIVNVGVVTITHTSQLLPSATDHSIYSKLGTHAATNILGSTRPSHQQVPRLEKGIPSEPKPDLRHPNGLKKRSVPSKTLQLQWTTKIVFGGLLQSVEEEISCPSSDHLCSGVSLNQVVANSIQFQHAEDELPAAASLHRYPMNLGNSVVQGGSFLWWNFYYRATAKNITTSFVWMSLGQGAQQSLNSKRTTL